MARAEELTVLIATLTERLDNTRRDIDAITVRCSKSDEVHSDLKSRLAVIDERLGEIKKALDLGSSRRWSLLPPVVGGIIGAILALLGQLVVRHFYP
jgi:hypothetical protein